MLILSSLFHLFILYSVCNCTIFISNGGSSVEILSVRASFGPSFIPTKGNLSIVFIEDVCTDFSVNSSNDFAILTNRWSKKDCSYVSMTLFAQSKGASALLVTNDEEGVWLLYTMLEDFSGRQDQITIPAFLVSVEDSRALMTTSFQISIQDSKDIFFPFSNFVDFGIAWNFYIWLFFTLNLILFFVSTYYLVESFIYKRIYHLKITFFLQVIYSLTQWIDMLVNHWGMRGLTHTRNLHVFYGVSIDAMLISFAHIAWMWYSLVTRRKVISENKIMRKREFVVIASLIVFADVVKLSLYGAGYSIRLSWTVYDVMLCLVAIALSAGLTLTGWRLRKEIKNFQDKEGNPAFTISVIALLTSLAFITVCVSLILWISVPALFGKWSWFIYNFVWRSFQVFFCVLLLSIFGFRRVLQGRNSSTIRDSKNYTRESNVASLEVELP